MQSLITRIQIRREQRRAEKALAALDLAASRVSANFGRYGTLIATTRRDVGERVDKVLQSCINEEGLLAFLVHFSAIAFHARAGLADQIRDQGHACNCIGFLKNGTDLIAYAGEIEGRNYWHAADLTNLAERYSQKVGQRMLPSAFLHRAAKNQAVNAWAKFSRMIALGDVPFSALAVGYEVERFYLEHCGRLLNCALERGGVDMPRRVSFACNAMAEVTNRASENMLRLNDFLGRKEVRLDPFVRAGARALDLTALVFEEAREAARPGDANSLSAYSKRYRIDAVIPQQQPSDAASAPGI